MFFSVIFTSIYTSKSTVSNMISQRKICANEILISINNIKVYIISPHKH